MKLLTMCFLFLSSNVYATPLSQIDGAGDAGGGDAYSLEFSLLAHQAVEVVQKAEISEVSSKDFAEAVKDVRVVSEEKLYLLGAEVDAINYPTDKKIVVSRSRWDQLEGMRDRKFKLVIHEYLSVLGLDDANYSLTEKIFANQDEDPVLSVMCFSVKNSKSERYGINIYKDAQPEVIKSVTQQDIDNGITKITYKALSTGSYNDFFMSKTNQILITFFDIYFTNKTIPLTFSKPINGTLNRSTTMHTLKRKHPKLPDFESKTTKMNCMRVLQ